MDSILWPFIKAMLNIAHSNTAAFSTVPKTTEDSNNRYALVELSMLTVFHGDCALIYNR